jgi:hypothetical protein
MRHAKGMAFVFFDFLFEHTVLTLDFIDMALCTAVNPAYDSEAKPHEDNYRYYRRKQDYHNRNNQRMLAHQTALSRI